MKISHWNLHQHDPSSKPYRMIIRDHERFRNFLLSSSSVYSDRQLSVSSIDSAILNSSSVRASFLVLNEIVIDRGLSAFISNVDLYLNGRLITRVQVSLIDWLIVDYPLSCPISISILTEDLLPSLGQFDWLIADCPLSFPTLSLISFIDWLIFYLNKDTQPV